MHTPTEKPAMSSTEDNRLQVWMHSYSVASVLEAYPQIFDVWEAIGVTGVLVSPMPFRPDKRIYDRFDVPTPESSGEASAEERRQLDRMFDDAKRRQWSILLFSPNSGAPIEVPEPLSHSLSEGVLFADPVTERAQAARILDTLSHFPQADGGILDGPEWGYEIAPGHRANIFDELPPVVERAAQSLHYDYRELVEAKDRFFERLHRLEGRTISLHASGGMLGAFHLFGSDPALLNWMKFRADSLTDFFATVFGLVRDMSPNSLLGVGVRSAAFGPLCGYDFARLMHHLDYLLPKHYFWHRGYDGFLGTVYRWMRVLTDWNRGISDAQALQVVRAWLGIQLPGVHSALDFEQGFPNAFFSEVVAEETRRALAVVDRPDQIVPWVDVGRRPHSGDPVGAGDFRRILEAAHGAGLRRFVFHHYPNMTPGELAVLRALCGDPQRRLPDAYQPPDITPAAARGGGRETPYNR